MAWIGEVLHVRHLGCQVSPEENLIGATSGFSVAHLVAAPSTSHVQNRPASQERSYGHMVKLVGIKGEEVNGYLWVIGGWHEDQQRDDVKVPGVVKLLFKKLMSIPA